MQRILSPLYEKYHKETKAQKRVIDCKNFTYRLLLQTIEPQLASGRRVLDIGCGAGTLSFYLANKGLKAMGIDISTKAIKACRLTAKKLDLAGNTEFSVLDFSKKTIPGQYDLALCLELIEHLKDNKSAIRKIYDNLKDGGLVIISTPSKNAPLYKLGLTKREDKRAGHLRRYTMEELTGLLKEAGLKIVETKKTEGIFRNFLFYNRLGRLPLKFANRFSIISDIFTFIDNITLKLFGESQLIVVAQKPKIKGK